MVKGKFYQQSSLGEGTPAYMEGLVDSSSPPFLPPLSPPPLLLKQVITLSLIECDPLFGKSQLRPRILDYVPV